MSSSGIVDRLLNTREACAVLRVSPKTLQRLRRAGRLAAYVFGHRTVRYRLEDLAAAARRDK